MQRTSSTDMAWRQWGDVDPYFAVVTDAKFLAENLNDQARTDFFESGRENVSHVLAKCRQCIYADFSPKRVLDYGCGVGRMALAFAQITEHVTGIDVSEGMLAEAQANAERFRIANVRWLKIEGSQLPIQKTFDLVHCYIVLQHIRPQIGLQLFQQLVQSIAPGGIGAIQMTYSRESFANNLGLPYSMLSARSLWRRLWLKSPLRRGLKSLMGHPISPVMEMNPYHLNQVFYLLQSLGVSETHVELTNHGGHLGVFLFFPRPDDAA
ncbi:methyltransferase domain-containing protein [bacterium]|nr:methyltransferase domain-containing protein [bacterium]